MCGVSTLNTDKNTMKTKSIVLFSHDRFSGFSILLAGLFILFATATSCEKNDDPETEESVTYSLEDMLGVWERHSLVTTSSGDGFWIHGSLINNNYTSAVALILPNSTWDTLYNGIHATMSATGILTTSQDPASHSYMSQDKNLIISTTTRTNQYTLVFDQRLVTGSNYLTADLKGSWKTHYLVGGGSWTGWVHATTTIANDGDFTVADIVRSDGGSTSQSGTFAISMLGTVTAVGPSNYHGFLSADKTLMISNMTDGGGGGGLAIYQKVISGTNYSKSDLTGKWQMHTLVAGIENAAERAVVTIDGDGDATFSEKVSHGRTFHDPGTISLAISPAGVVSSDPGFHAYMSADKKLIIGTRGDDTDGYTLMALQKMP
jgi:hypothetical protein